MATFQQWLSGNEDGPQDDPVAWLARAWKSQEGSRPRVSSASGIEKHMLTLAHGSDAEQDQWTGYVHLAVNAAVDKFRAEKSPAGGKNTSSAGTQQELPADAAGTAIEQSDRNPATGKPVAVVSSKQWAEHPDASKYGSCETCGWPRGLAIFGANTGPVMTCAAGHVFVPQKPGPTDAGPAVTTSPGATAGPAAGDVAGRATHDAQPGKEAHAVLDGPDPDAQVWKALDGEPTVADMLEVLNIKLDAILVSLGLPLDPRHLAVLLSQAIGEAETGGPDDGLLLSAQLRAATGELAAIPPEPGSQADGGPIPSWTMPQDFAAWYGAADPAAEGDGPAS